MKQRINPIYLMNRPAHKIVQRVGTSTWVRSSGGQLTAYYFIGFGADEFGKIKMMPRGGGAVTFTRDTAGSLTDFESLVQTGQVQEMRFDEARRVETLWPSGSSEDFSELPGGPVYYSNATVAADGKTVTISQTVSYGFLDDFTVEPGEVYTLSIETSGGTCEGVTNAVRDQTNEAFIFDDMKLTLSERSARAFTVPAGCTAIRIYIFRYVTTIGTIVFENAQLEQGDKVSEYVSKGVLSVPYHGLNVDGVAQFAHDNGLTVDSNDKVTEAKGADLTTEWGALFEPASINEAPKSTDFTTGSFWFVGGDCDTEESPDVSPVFGKKWWKLKAIAGGVSTRSLRTGIITKDAAVEYWTQSLYVKKDEVSWVRLEIYNSAANSYVLQYYDLTNGVVGTPLVSNWTYYRSSIKEEATGVYLITLTALTDAVDTEIRSRMFAALGDGQAFNITLNPEDGFYMQGHQLEEKQVPTSLILTDTTAVTRTIDDGRLMYDINGNLDLEKGSLVVDLRWNSDYNDISQAFEKIISFANFAEAFLYYASDEGSIYSHDGTNACKISLPFVANKTYRIGLTWSVDNGINLSWKNITDSGSWQTWANTPFGGTYQGSPNGKIRIGDTTTFYRPLRYRDLRIWQQDQGTQFIEDNY